MGGWRARAAFVPFDGGCISVSAPPIQQMSAITDHGDVAPCDRSINDATTVSSLFITAAKKRLTGECVHAYGWRGINGNNVLKTRPSPPTTVNVVAVTRLRKPARRGSENVTS